MTLGYINEKKLNLEEESHKIFNETDIEKYGDIVKERNYSKYNIDNLEKGLFSKLTNLKIDLKNVSYENDENIEFAYMFKELNEILLFGIIPILIEGIRLIAINYLKEILNYEIIPIRLTKNTKVEELFNKKKINMKNDIINIEETPTNFFEILKDEKKAENSIILFENLNQASPAILDKLAEIINKKRKRITFTRWQ